MKWSFECQSVSVEGTVSSWRSVCTHSRGVLHCLIQSSYLSLLLCPVLKWYKSSWKTNTKSLIQPIIAASSLIWTLKLCSRSVVFSCCKHWIFLLLSSSVTQRLKHVLWLKEPHCAVFESRSCFEGFPTHSLSCWLSSCFCCF